LPRQKSTQCGGIVFLAIKGPHEMKEKNQNESISDIFSILRKEILELSIKPGETLVESSVCERFNASRPPVRNAFQRLSDQGLIDIVPYRGVTVSLLDLDYIHQMVHLRSTLETRILVDFINNKPNPFVIEELEHNIRKQEIFVNQVSIDKTEFYKLDSNLHNIWFQYQKCEDLWNLIQKQEIHYTRFRLLDYGEMHNYAELYSEHIMLLEAIKTNDTHEISTIVENHLVGGLRRLGTKVFNEYRDFFKEPKNQEFWEKHYKY
jgi:DNA-binding GntR family transcriptional regulator